MKFLTNISCFISDCPEAQRQLLRTTTRRGDHECECFSHDCSFRFGDGSSFHAQPPQTSGGPGLRPGSTPGQATRWTCVSAAAAGVIPAASVRECPHPRTDVPDDVLFRDGGAIFNLRWSASTSAPSTVTSEPSPHYPGPHYPGSHYHS